MLTQLRQSSAPTAKTAGVTPCIRVRSERMAAQPNTQPKPSSPREQVGPVKALPQTIFISEKRGVPPAPPPKR
jgi:hypothetical protein